MIQQQEAPKLEAAPAPIQPLAALGQEAKLARRQSGQMGLFQRELLWIALQRAFVMLRPDIQWKNPVMFVVEIGTVLCVLYTIAMFLGYASQVSWQYLVAL